MLVASVGFTSSVGDSGEVVPLALWVGDTTVFEGRLEKEVS
jgi:hypothetical protein